VRRSDETKAIVWTRNPSARPARETSLFDRRPLEGLQRPKKPGPSLLQAASPVWRGAPVRLRLPVFRGRFAGLLSGSPPTDTRPQARAYWANAYLVESRVDARGFSRVGRTFSVDGSDARLIEQQRPDRLDGSLRFRWRSFREFDVSHATAGADCEPLPPSAGPRAVERHADVHKSGDRGEGIRTD
jgi:hypothetical protein